MSDAAAEVTDLGELTAWRLAPKKFLKLGNHWLVASCGRSAPQSPILRRELSPKQAGNCGDPAPTNRLGHP